VQSEESSLLSLAQDGVRHFGDARHDEYIVDADDVSAAGDADGDGGSGAFDALVGGRAEGVTDEALAGGAKKERITLCPDFA
jgi:hypothetical protein